MNMTSLCHVIPPVNDYSRRHPGILGGPFSLAEAPPSRFFLTCHRAGISNQAVMTSERTTFRQPRSRSSFAVFPGETAIRTAYCLDYHLNSLLSLPLPTQPYTRQYITQHAPISIRPFISQHYPQHGKQHT